MEKVQFIFSLVIYMFDKKPNSSQTVNYYGSESNLYLLLNAL